MIRYLLLLLGLFALLAHLVVISLLTAAILHVTGITQIRSAIVWIASAPLVYLLWLTVLVVVFIVEVQIIAKVAPKPRRLSAADGPRAIVRLVGLAGFYRRAVLMAGLPLTRTLMQHALLRTPLLLAYGSSVHISRRAAVYGYIFDPDLTHIGDAAVVGCDATLVAHAMTLGSDGKLFFASAPIEIAPRAVIGGHAFIAMGVMVGAGSVVEVGSTVLPYTVIPPGQVWGGNPAVFLRWRPGLSGDADELPEHHDGRAHPRAVPGTSPTNADVEEDLRGLVADALDLPRERVNAALEQANCMQWDSLGQMALAAAVYNRFGVTLTHEQVFSIRTFPALVEAVRSSYRSAPSELPPEPAALPDNPELLPLLDRVAATRALARREQGETPGVTAVESLVIVAASFTADSLAASLKLWSRAFGVECQVRFCDFDQVVQSLLATDSPMHSAPEAIKVVLVRVEDLPGTTADERAESAGRVLDAIERFAGTAACGGALVVGTLPPSIAEQFTAARADMDVLRAGWQQRLTRMVGVEVLDFAAVIERVGTAAAASPGFDVVARAPFAPQVYQDLGIDLARVVRRRSGRFAPAKVIAVDCDGTLWGGVVAEDGPAGIELGDDGRARAYSLFQQYLLRLKKKGVMLALVSRNEEADVREVFDHHPGMVLSVDDIAAWRINWDDKSKNLQSLAEELNVDLDAFVFVDDDPAVRLEVMARARQVTVVPLPEEPEQYAATLGRLWLFDGDVSTSEDRHRTQMVQQQGQRDRARASAPALDDYLTQLDLVVDFRAATARDLPRVAQLTQKTNQFNLSLRRRNLDQIQALGEVTETYVVSASDRYGDYGTIGVGIVGRTGDGSETVELDTLLVSCRALGRGIEQAFLKRLCDVARAQGARRLQAPFVPGPRNQPVLRFLQGAGFAAEPDNILVRSLDDDVVVPAHIRWVRAAENRL